MMTNRNNNIPDQIPLESKYLNSAQPEQCYASIKIKCIALRTIVRHICFSLLLLMAGAAAAAVVVAAPTIAIPTLCNCAVVFPTAPVIAW